ncbi:MAG: hypothetical protein KAU58_00820 [Candidatus Omnitrophica bacterium]|nr:hypothetical protein [Candidatus Omnitrophota bacterium]
MYKKFIFVLIFLLSLFFYTRGVHGITIGPSRFEVSLPPGEIAVADYYVQNETDKPIHVVVEPENWFRDAYLYKDLAIEDWIKLDTYEFDLEPKEIKKLKLTIKVPVDVTGELVAQIFFTSAAGGGKSKVGAVRARLGAVLYVAIKGTEKIDAEIENIFVSKITTQGKEALQIKVRVRNKGNVHLRPKGKVLIEDRKGEKIGEFTLLYGRAVLPRKHFDYHAFWEEPELKKGKYSVQATINYGKIFNVEKDAAFEKSFVVDKSGKVVIK